MVLEEVDVILILIAILSKWIQKIHLLFQRFFRPYKRMCLLIRMFQMGRITNIHLRIFHR